MIGDLSVVKGDGSCSCWECHMKIEAGERCVCNRFGYISFYFCVECVCAGLKGEIGMFKKVVGEIDDSLMIEEMNNNMGSEE